MAERRKIPVELVDASAIASFAQRNLGEFDRIFTLEHGSEPELSCLGKHFQELLGPGGELMLVEPPSRSFTRSVGCWLDSRGSITTGTSLTSTAVYRRSGSR